MTVKVTTNVVAPFAGTAMLGGADAIQKTTYGVGQGTDPAATSDGASTAHPASGTGPNFLAWGIGVVAVLVALAYLVGVLG